MGIFKVNIEVCKIGKRPGWVLFKNVIVETGSKFTWLSGHILRRVGIDIFKKDQKFVMANGQEVTRDIGIGIIKCGDFKTVDEIVLSHPGDLLLLGARTIEGFNALVDSRKKKLVAAGPIPAL